MKRRNPDGFSSSGLWNSSDNWFRRTSPQCKQMCAICDLCGRAERWLPACPPIRKLRKPTGITLELQVNKNNVNVTSMWHTQHIVFSYLRTLTIFLCFILLTFSGDVYHYKVPLSTLPRWSLSKANGNFPYWRLYVGTYTRICTWCW